MLTVCVIEKLDFVARTVCEIENRPFGGIQLVMAGDFYQLLPVTNKQDDGQFCSRQYGVRWPSFWPGLGEVPCSIHR